MWNSLNCILFTGQKLCKCYLLLNVTVKITVSHYAMPVTIYNKFNCR